MVRSGSENITDLVREGLKTNINKFGRIFRRGMHPQHYYVLKALNMNGITGKIQNRLFQEEI